MGRAAKGRCIANLLELKPGEKIAALIRVLSKTDANKEDATWKQEGFLFFATQQARSRRPRSPILPMSAKAASSPSASNRATR